MGLRELEVRNFRLFEHLVVKPDPNAITVFISPNGTGKTSVLEAIHALATATSFRTHTAADMIRNNSDLAEVHGLVFHHERRVSVDLTLTRGTRTQKRILVNNQRPQSRASLSEVLPITVFTPEGVEVIRGGPENRRNFITTLMTDVDLSTGDLIERYARVLSQRNAVLRSWHGERPTSRQRDEIAVWSTDLARHGSELLAARLELSGALAPGVEDNYRRLAGQPAEVTLSYQRSWSGELFDALMDSLDEDRVRGYTTRGPHRDDIQVLLNGNDARHQASQGEQRSLALSMRLAGDELVRERRGVDPLLLLDDVFSELDSSRSDRLLSLLPSGQTLVTTASPLPASLHPAAVIDLTEAM